MNTLRSILFLTISAVASLAAEPEWKSILTPVETGPHPKLEPIILDYQASWKGILNSGHLHLEFAPPDERKSGVYIVKAYANSQGAAAKLHPYKYDAWAELHASTLRSRYIRSSESDKNGSEVSEVRYFSDRVESESIFRPSGKGGAETHERSFAHPGIFDLFAAMLHIRSQRLDTGDEINIVIQSTDQPYLLKVRCVGREEHHDQPAIKLIAGMRKIDRKTLELKPYKKLKRDATLWLSDDQDRVPLEVRADIFVGDVRAVLTQRKKP